MRDIFRPIKFVPTKPTKAGLRLEPVEFVIPGEPASKANSRQLVYFRGKPRFIKSEKARNYTRDFGLLCPKLNPYFLQAVKVELDIWYASERSDLDESIILDAMQGKVYNNDRQVREKIVRWHLDRANPRARIRVSPLAGGGNASGQ